MPAAVLLAGAIGGGSAIIAGTSILKGVLIGGALGGAAQLLAPKPPNFDFSADSSGPDIDTRSTAISAIEPARWVLGRARTGGSLKFYQEVGERDVWMAFAISEGPCQAIEKIWVDGEEASFTRTGLQSGNRLALTGEFAGKATIYQYFAADGNQGAEIRSACSNFTANHRFRGLSWVAVHLTQPEYSSADGRFWTRRPEIQYLVQGLRFSWPGQANPIWTDNAAAVRWYVETVRGGLDPAAVDRDSFDAAVSVCGATVTIPASMAAGYSRTGRRYTVNGVLTAGMTLQTVRRELDFCWQGYVAEAGGVQYWMPGADRAAVGAIGESDTISIGEVRPAPALQDRVNAVSMSLAQCRDTGYQPFDVPETLDAQALSRDDDFHLPLDAGNRQFVTGALDALRIQAIMLRRARPSMTIAMTVMPGLALARYGWKPGDRITVTNSEYGFSNLLCEINSVAIEEATGAVALVLNEAVAGAYADTLDLPPARRRLIAIAGPRSVPAVSNLRGDETAIVQGDGSSVVHLTVTHDHAGYRSEIQIRLQGRTDLLDEQDATRGIARYAGAIPGRTYEFRARQLSHDGHAGPWTAWGSRTISGDLTPPAKPSGLQFAALPGGFRATWAWPTVDDFKHSLVWLSTTSSNFADAVLVGRVTDPEFSRLGFASAVQARIWVRHVDRSGNEGAVSDILIGDTLPPVRAPDIPAQRGAKIFRLALSAAQTRIWRGMMFSGGGPPAAGTQVPANRTQAQEDLVGAIDAAAGAPQDGDWLQLTFADYSISRTLLSAPRPEVNATLRRATANAADGSQAAGATRQWQIRSTGGAMDYVDLGGRTAALITSLTRNRWYRVCWTSGDSTAYSDAFQIDSAAGNLVRWENSANNTVAETATTETAPQWLTYDGAIGQWRAAADFIAAPKIRAIDIEAVNISAIQGDFSELNVTGQLSAGQVDAANIRSWTNLYKYDGDGLGFRIDRNTPLTIESTAGYSLIVIVGSADNSGTVNDSRVTITGSDTGKTYLQSGINAGEDADILIRSTSIIGVGDAFIREVWGVKI